MYELLIKNGRVYDGTGSPAYASDIAIANGAIVAIGALDGDAAKTIDANGMAVCPGFIDLHTHSDMSFLLEPTAQSKVRQGVTLELAGNCGSSFCAPLIGSSAEAFKARLSQYTSDFEVTWDGFGGTSTLLKSQVRRSIWPCRLGMARLGRACWEWTPELPTPTNSIG